jgi:fluoride exporter
LFNVKILLLIGSGGFVGSVLRYLLSQTVQNKFLSSFPYGTMSVNIIGSLCIGIVYGLVEKGNLSPEARLFLATGILGGFTTFSAFTLDALNLLQEGLWLESASYVLLSVILGIVFAFLGIFTIKLF